MCVGSLGGVLYGRQSVSLQGVLYARLNVVWYSRLSGMRHAGLDGVWFKRLLWLANCCMVCHVKPSCVWCDGLNVKTQKADSNPTPTWGKTGENNLSFSPGRVSHLL